MADIEEYGRQGRSRRRRAAWALSAAAGMAVAAVCLLAEPGCFEPALAGSAIAAGGGVASCAYAFFGEP